MENPSNVCIPEDVMVEILLRLPVKTLLRFKCVCKNWYTLIESPSFVNWHFGHESNQERLLIRNYKPDEEKYAFALYVDEVFSRYEEPVHLQMPETVTILMGPVNGVFCVAGISGQISLLNPAMRQFKPLPLPNPKSPPNMSANGCVLGFGLDSSRGDYKLVVIHFFWDDDMDTDYPSLASVYNSASDSWRQLEEGDLVNSSRLAFRSLWNTYLNGVYYWVMESNDPGSGSAGSILAFDMINDKFQEIQVPNYIKEGDLALYGDSIALLSRDFSDKCIDVWVLGKEGRWTKSATVGPFQDIERPWPLGFCRENELLLETSTSYLTMYNIYTKKVTTVEARTHEDDDFTYWVFSYKESLVSLKGEGDKCKLWDTSSDFVKDFLKLPRSYNPFFVDV